MSGEENRWKQELEWQWIGKNAHVNEWERKRDDQEDVNTTYECEWECEAM